MDYKKLIRSMQDEKPEYFICVGEEGYEDYKAHEVYFMEKYRPEYTKKLTVIVMLLTTWYETYVLFETEDKELSRTYSRYNKRVFKLETEKQVMDIKNMISQSMTDKEAEINFLFEDKLHNERFLLNILYDLCITFHGLSPKKLDYVKNQALKQGLMLWETVD